MPPQTLHRDRPLSGKLARAAVTALATPPFTPPSPPSTPPPLQRSTPPSEQSLIKYELASPSEILPPERLPHVNRDSRDLIDKILEIRSNSQSKITPKQKRNWLRDILSTNQEQQIFYTDTWYPYSLENNPKKPVYIKLRLKAYKAECNPKGKNKGRFNYLFIDPHLDEPMERGNQADIFPVLIYAKILEGQLELKITSKNGNTRLVKRLRQRIQDSAPEDLMVAARQEAIFARQGKLHAGMPILERDRQDETRFWAIIPMRKLRMITLKDFRHLLKENRVSYSDHQLLKIIYALCCELYLLHEKEGIVHCDIKPANMMADTYLIPELHSGNIAARIVDYGLSYSSDKKPEEMNAGTLNYKAPECFHDNLNKYSDIWSLGISIWEMLGGENKMASRLGPLDYNRYMRTYPDFKFDISHDSSIQRKLAPMLRAMTRGDSNRRCHMTGAIKFLSELIIAEKLKFIVDHKKAPLSDETIDSILQQSYPFELNPKKQYEVIFTKPVKTKLKNYINSSLDVSWLPSFLSRQGQDINKIAQIVVNISQEIVNCRSEAQQLFLIDIMIRTEFLALRDYITDLIRSQHQQTPNSDNREKLSNKQQEINTLRTIERLICQEVNHDSLKQHFKQDDVLMLIEHLRDLRAFNAYNLVRNLIKKIDQSSLSQRPAARLSI